MSRDIHDCKSCSFTYLDQTVMLAESNNLVSPKWQDEAGFRVLSLNSGNGRVRMYKKRRAHAKTNSGCFTCRAKRVKCDESRPVCTRCRRNDRSCVYGPLKGTKLGQTSLSVLSAITSLPFPGPRVQNGTPSTHILQHLSQHWFEVFSFPCVDQVLALFRSYAIVRNTMLAVAACHLRNMSPGVSQHRIAEHFQQSMALQDCQKLMSTPTVELGQSGVNAMLFSAVLLNIVAFALPVSEWSDNSETDPGTSWVFRPREDSLNWLALQEGLRHLFRSTGPYLDQAMSFLGQIFLDPDEDPWTHSTMPSNVEGVPEKWIVFFRLRDAHPDDACSSCDSMDDSGSSGEHIEQLTTDPHSNVFYLPVLALSCSLSKPSAGFNVFHNFTFLSKVHTNFRALLSQRDEKALWLFGYWLGLMSRYEDLWWCGKRVKRDHKAIRMWLHQARVTTRSGAEGELWREMMLDFDNAVVHPR